MTTSFKLLGAALVLASSTLMGFYLSYRLKRRLKLLNALCELMSSLCTGVRYSRENVITLVRRSSPRLILDVLPDENNPRTFLQKTVESLQSSFYLTDNDESLLTDFFSKLGSTDTDGQLEHINIYKISFKTACDNSLEVNLHKLVDDLFDESEARLSTLFKKDKDYIELPTLSQEQLIENKIKTVQSAWILRRSLNCSDDIVKE